MRYLFFAILFLFHPMWYPLYGMLAYLLYSPHYLPVEYLKYIWTILIISTAVIPTLFYIGLRLVGWMPTPFSIKKENKTVIIYGYMTLLFVVNQQFALRQAFPELSYYLLSLLIGYFLSVLLAYLQISVSLYTMSIGNLTGFVILLGKWFGIDIVIPLASLLFISGLVASARIYHQQQTLDSVLFGLLLGFIPPIWVLRWFDFV